MTGQAFINNVDISTFGAVLVKGAYEALLTPPSAKPYVTSSSRLQTGTKVIAPSSAFRYQSRDVTIGFFIQGATESAYLANVEAFMNAITAGEISFAVPRLNKIYKFIYTSVSKYGDYGLKNGKFVVKFTENDVSSRQSYGNN